MARLHYPVAALAAALSDPALAEGGLVDQVEKLEIEAGELELESQAILARRAGESTVLLGLTTEYGVSDRLQLGIELESEREAGEALALESVNLQFKWIVLDPEEGAVGLGLQSALVIDTHGGGLGSETYFIAESRQGGFDLTANLIVETEPGEFSDAAASYALRADREVSQGLALGLEAGGALSGEGEGSHFLGPVLAAALGNGGEREAPELELSLFFPLSEEAPDVQFRLELDLAF